MSKFIWVRDRDKKEHFVNVDHIVRVTRVKSSSVVFSDYAYIVLNEGAAGSKHIDLAKDEFDTYEDIIAKIQQVSV